MPQWAKILIEVVVFSAIILIIYYFIKKYIISRLKVNKWIILTLAVITFLLPSLLSTLNVNVNNGFLGFALSGLFVIFFLWFMDSMGWSGEKIAQKRINSSSRNSSKKKDNIVIKPKAKPNRVKNKEVK